VRNLRNPAETKEFDDSDQALRLASQGRGLISRASGVAVVETLGSGEGLVTLSAPAPTQQLRRRP